MNYNYSMSYVKPKKSNKYLWAVLWVVLGFGIGVTLWALSQPQVGVTGL